MVAVGMASTAWTMERFSRILDVRDEHSTYPLGMRKVPRVVAREVWNCRREGVVELLEWREQKFSRTRFAFNVTFGTGGMRQWTRSSVPDGK